MTKYFRTDFKLEELLHFLEACAKDFSIDMSSEVGVAINPKNIIVGCNHAQANKCLTEKSGRRLREIDKQGNINIQPRTQILFNYQFFV